MTNTLKNMRYTYFILSIILGLIGCRKDDFEKPDYYPTPPGNYLVETIQYNSILGIDPNLLSIDIYHFGDTIPNKPVVIWVHGGGWRKGDKSEWLNNKLHLCSEMGYILVSVNYRLSPYPGSSDPNSIRYPIHNNDVADAVKWVYDSIANYGGINDKIVLLGHSAGAHLVSLTGTSNLFLPARDIPLNALKGIASIDTEGYDVSQRVEEADLDLYRNAFGTDPSVLFEASPINHLFSGTNYPKFFIAKRGTENKTANSLAFIDKLQAIGASVSVVDGSQYDHNGINRAIGAPNETAVTDPFKTFLIECFQ
jgi:acetyl esterase/lipase